MYQIELLEPMKMRELRDFGEKLHTLSIYLGEDHDLAVLRKALVDSVENDMSMTRVVGAIDVSRRKLQQAAVRLGKRIYSEKPKSLIERMEIDWKVWRSR